MEKSYKKVLPEEIFLSGMPEYVADEAAMWQGKIDPARPGRYLTGCDALDAFVDLLHRMGVQTPSVYAREMGVRTEHLNGFMLVVSGLPTKVWRDRYLLLMAKEWLEKSALPIGEVRQRLGFVNFAFFCRWFQKQTGRQPIEWRLGYREGTKRRKYHYDD